MLIEIAAKPDIARALALIIETGAWFTHLGAVFTDYCFPVLLLAYLFHPYLQAFSMLKQKVRSEEQSIDSHVRATAEIEAGKSTAIIAHITLIGLIAAFIMNNDKKNTFSAYHIRQVLGLAVTGLALMVISIIPVLGWLTAILGYILLVIMWVAGLINAVNGKEKPMPIFGKQYMQWFKGV